MNKKLVMFFTLLLMTNIYTQTNINAMAAEKVAIPQNAIRLRILANSDSTEDQALKREIRDEVNHSITTWVEDLSTKDAAEKVIQAHIPEIKEIIQGVMKEQNNEQPYTVELTQTKFPTKLYGEIMYPAGTYEALKIELGKGEGANWWCVLYPPLCFLDFSSSTATEKEKPSKNVDNSKPDVKKAEVRFFIVDIFESIFQN